MRRRVTTPTDEAVNWRPIHLAQSRQCACRLRQVRERATCDNAPVCGSKTRPPSCSVPAVGFIGRAYQMAVGHSRPFYGNSMVKLPKNSRKVLLFSQIEIPGSHTGGLVWRLPNNLSQGQNCCYCAVRKKLRDGATHTPPGIGAPPYLLRTFFESSRLTVQMREDFAGEMK